ncbi:substrate-binding domain-containing protein, partial [Escherichia coli]
MNKYLKYFSGTLVGLMLSTSAFAAAEYAVVLKTLSNPFWVDMKKGIEDEAKTLGVSVDIFASPSEGDFQSQLQLFEDLSNKNYKGIAFAPLSSVNLVMPVARAWKKGIYLVNLDEKIDMDNLKKAGGNVEGFVTTDNVAVGAKGASFIICLLYTSPSPRDISGSRMPSSAWKAGGGGGGGGGFHAEDGIRDPEMSRGLGDVYKRQH